MFHYTEDSGYKAIGSQIDWLFKASQPPGDHPKGAYFTTLPPDTPNLGKRLFVRGCREKTRYFFEFAGSEGLSALRGGRGRFVFYSSDDYLVTKDRQLAKGSTDSVEEEST